MEIYNKGKRDFIIAREDMISVGGMQPEEPKDALSKKYFHITPDLVCDIKDGVAVELIRRYPKEIFQWGKSTKKE